MNKNIREFSSVVTRALRSIDVGKGYRKGTPHSQTPTRVLHVKDPFRTAGAFDIETGEGKESDDAYCKMTCTRIINPRVVPFRWNVLEIKKSTANYSR